MQKPKHPFQGVRQQATPTPAGGTSQELKLKRPAFTVREDVGNSAPVAAPTPVQAAVEKDSRYVHVDLPSGCFFYPFDTVSVRLVTAAEQAKFNRAHNERKLRHLVDAISATMEAGKSAYELTLPDFNWLLYWHRLNGYTKMPYRHRAVCSNEQHQARVVAGELDEKTLLLEEILTKSFLQETVFDPTKYQETRIREVLCEPATMRDSVEIDELPESDDKDELLWLADLAAYLDHSLSLRARIDLVSQFEPDEVETLRQYAESVSEYGVVEQVTLKCRECGAPTTSNVVVDALSFLPSSR